MDSGKGTFGGDGTHRQCGWDGKDGKPDGGAGRKWRTRLSGCGHGGGLGQHDGFAPGEASNRGGGAGARGEARRSRGGGARAAALRSDNGRGSFGQRPLGSGPAFSRTRGDRRAPPHSANEGATGGDTEADR
jgi:hypothetical protein